MFCFSLSDKPINAGFTPHGVYRTTIILGNVTVTLVLYKKKSLINIMFTLINNNVTPCLS